MEGIPGIVNLMSTRIKPPDHGKKEYCSSEQTSDDCVMTVATDADRREREPM